MAPRRAHAEFSGSDPGRGDGQGRPEGASKMLLSTNLETASDHWRGEGVEDASL